MSMFIFPPEKSCITFIINNLMNHKNKYYMK